MRSFFLFALIISIVALLGSPRDLTLEAHGDMKQIYQGRAGDHLLKVSVLPHKPMVGHVHFSIEPSASSTGLPVEQALITITARNGKEAFQSRAVNSTFSPTMYDANLTFYEEGSWMMSVEISTTPGQEDEVEFLMDISGDSVINDRSAGYFFLFVFLVLVIGASTLTLRYRKKNMKDN